MVLVFAVAAAADLGFIALAVILSIVNPHIGFIGDAGSVLSYFTFYPSVWVAATTLTLGALAVWRSEVHVKLALINVGLGVLSAAFVVTALLPHFLR